MRKLALACVLAASLAVAQAQAQADEAPVPSPSPSPSVSPTPGPAAPVDPKVREEARKLFEDANVDYAKGDYKASIEKLLKVTALDPSLAGGWRNLGLSYKADAQCKEAITAFTEYLRLQPDSRYSPRVRKEIEDCRGKLGSAAGVVLEGEIGAIAVRVGNAEGATVSIDGIMRGAAGGEPFKITPGSHELKIERPGYLPKTVNVEVLKGVTSDVSITLDEDPDAPIELRLGPGSKPVNELPDTAGLKLTLADPTLTVEVLIDNTPVQAGPGSGGYYIIQPGIVTVEVRAAGKDSWRRRVVLIKGQKREVAVAMKSTAVRARGRKLAWIALGVSGALLATGVTFGLMENDKSESARDIIYAERARPGSAAGAPDIKTRADYDGLIEDGKTLGLVANISYGLAAVSLGASVYFFVKSRSDERPGLAPGFAVSPMVNPKGGVGMAVTRTVKW